jgi:hypothetical protein
VLSLHPALEDRSGNRADRLFDRSAGTPVEAGTVLPPVRMPFEVPER